MVRFCLLILALAIPLPTSAQHALAESGPYDPGVPTPEEVLGYELGERFTPHHRIVRYAEAVAAASPRVRLDTVAYSYEGREVLLLVATGEENQARLEEIMAGAKRLADPRGVPEDELERLVRTMPAIVWLGYTVHGDEASGVEAALAVLYQLAAGQDAATRAILDRTVALIDPVQNPDGHERHVQQVLWDLGVFGPDPYPDAVVHEHDWHGGRTNHYLFDLNRDWIVHAHPETRGRMAVFRQWYPHVAADLHEMGASSTYFFAPPMAPVHENIHPLVRQGWRLFAQGNASAFAREGWGFFTREGYDEFFPGYGPSWPIHTGAVGMTYEQGSSEGGAIRRDDGSVLTLREAARHHYAASMATLATAAANARERVRDYLAFRQDAIRANADPEMRTILLEPDAQGRAEALVANLLRHGIEVGRTTRAMDVRATPYGQASPRGVDLPSGSYVVDLAQPQGLLARTLLEPDPSFDPAFIEEELERRRAGLGNRFYDMTGWALPFLYRVDAWWSDDHIEDLRPVTDPEAGPVGVAAPAPATYAYAFRPGPLPSLRMLSGLLADSVRVRHARLPFRAAGQEFPHGAFVVLVNRNRGDVHEVVRTLAEETGAEVVPINSALVTEGTDLGSNSVAAIPVPRVALVGGEGVSSYSFGAAWYTFDQLLRFPATRIRLEDLVDALEDFDVVVLPSAFGLSSALGEAGSEALRAWVRGGGTLVTLEAATGWVASEDGMGRLRSSRTSDPAEPADPGPEAGGADEAGGHIASDTDAVDGAPLPASVPGAILRAVSDTLSPIMAGVTDREVPVMLDGSRIYLAPDDVRPGEVVLRYAPEDRLRLAGFLWPEVPSRVAGTTYLWTERIGDGRLVAFTGDPNARAMWPGLLPLFANAVFLGGSF